jgi:hypothetical protein
MIQAPGPKFHFMSLEQAKAPKEHIVYNIVNSWWVVHPEKGLTFWGKGYGSPQCNTNEAISKRLYPPWGEVKFIERVFAPCNVGDYCD